MLTQQYPQWGTHRQKGCRNMQASGPRVHLLETHVDTTSMSPSVCTSGSFVRSIWFANSFQSVYMYMYELKTDFKSFTDQAVLTIVRSRDFDEQLRISNSFASFSCGKQLALHCHPIINMSLVSFSLTFTSMSSTKKQFFFSPRPAC